MNGSGELAFYWCLIGCKTIDADFSDMNVMAFLEMENFQMPALPPKIVGGAERRGHGSTKPRKFGGRLST